MVLIQNYRITSEAIREHGCDIMDLPYLKNTNVDEMHHFYRKLNASVSSFKFFKQIGNSRNTGT